MLKRENSAFLKTDDEEDCLKIPFLHAQSASSFQSHDGLGKGETAGGGESGERERNKPINHLCSPKFTLMDFSLVDKQSCKLASRNATMSLGLGVLIPNSISTHE